jgi:hypothetical protein
VMAQKIDNSLLATPTKSSLAAPNQYKHLPGFQHTSKSEYMATQA